MITEDDVDAAIGELSRAPVERSDDIVFNMSTGKYELAPDVYKRAIRDGVIRRIQDKRISEFLENYRPETFTKALGKDIGTGTLFLIVLGILGGLFY